MSKGVPVFQPPEKRPPSAPISRLIEVLLGVGLTGGLLIPCLWQRHIQAGDLSSHVYNAWLATQIKNDSSPGLFIAHAWTNVLSDWTLEALLPLVGPAGAERAVVGAAVLLFFWGAFYLIHAVDGRRPWLLSPGLAMLAYGLIFNLGFLNFYISTGISLWIMGLLWNATPKRALLSIPLWILAVLAHPMPVAWAAGFVGYTQLVRHGPVRLRPITAPIALVALALIQFIMMRSYSYRWSLDQSVSFSGALGMTGVEQVFLHGGKYLIVVVGLLAIWCALFLERLDRGHMMRDPVFQVWLLQLVVFVAMPSAVQLPSYQHVFAFIPQRLSLFNAILLCVMVGGARYGRGITRLTALVATIFFTFLFLDSRAFNAVEGQVQELIAGLPPGQRVVAEITDSNSRLQPLLHIVDLSCIGHCFSYSNYEPATAQFRIRVAGPNRIVAPSMSVVKELEEGRHIVTADEAPLYSLCDCDGALCVRRLDAGAKTCSFSMPISPGFAFFGN